MTTTTSATAKSPRIRSRVPNTRVLHAINPRCLCDPPFALARPASGEVLLLTFTGRKSGLRYTVPVGYTREGDMYAIPSVHPRWKNLRGGAQVTVLLQGRQRAGHAEVIEDREAVLAEVDHLIARYGRKGAGRRIGIALDTAPAPSRDEVAEAMRGRVVIRIVLDA